MLHALCVSCFRFSIHRADCGLLCKLFSSAILAMQMLKKEVLDIGAHPPWAFRSACMCSRLALCAPPKAGIATFPPAFSVAHCHSCRVPLPVLPAFADRQTHTRARPQARSDVCPRCLLVFVVPLH